ncbi:hypothetical protein [Thalassotalea sp. ND16A]|uniref:hypothetical protein n=1 Tax=Thalassotalea sp. ND16A TaxID=1535422 RepID=UPI00051CF590|nr:hypothetical protein [Thalassotalea sp. ND16A]KGJ93457.1 hypothetical protein ND16A_1502 [Thalassotalea sp. ND16A]
MKNFYLSTFAMLFIVSLTACMATATEQQSKVKSSQAQQTTPAPATKKAIVMKDNTPPPNELSKGELPIGQWYTGTLKYYNLEGGFFGFHGDNGERLLPLNLEKRFQQHGAKIKLFGYVDKNIMTIQMWGTPFKVQKVELIKAGEKSRVNPKDI